MFFLWKCAIRHKCTIEKKNVVTQCICHVFVKQAFGDFLLGYMLLQTPGNLEGL
jgi:hypothetical protein